MRPNHKALLLLLPGVVSSGLAEESLSADEGLGIDPDNPDFLYRADAVNFRDYYFELGRDDGAKALRITPDVRAEFYGRIRDELLAIHQFYGHPAVE